MVKKTDITAAEETSVIQETFKEKIVHFVDSLVAKAKVKIDGEWIDLDIFKTIIEGDTVRKYVYIEEDVGVISEAQLLTNDDKVLAIKKYEIQKNKDGLVLTFQFKVAVDEVSLGFIESR